MSEKWRVLDLFCGAGGAAMGLHRAWADAEIIGIDIMPQPRYPFRFVQGDALKPPFDLREFDFIWASPPCQAYSFAALRHRNAGKSYPDLVAPVREMLKKSGVPYVIENVEGAPLNVAITLCGTMFRLRTFRHRVFESDRLLLQPPHAKHTLFGKAVRQGSAAKHDHEYMSITGHFANLPIASKAIGITWMNKRELSQAIPPAYAAYIARQIRQVTP